MAGIVRRMMNAFGIAGAANPSFEAAGHGRRLRGFNPSKDHVNAAIEKAGPTLMARARWLYKNDGYAGNAVDEWTSAVVGDGIKPRPKVPKGMSEEQRAEKKRELVDLFWRWTEEADHDGMSDFYGQEEKIAREAYLVGEVFVRIRKPRPESIRTVPLQLQVLPAEMLDHAFHDNLANGHYIRAGIEFDSRGKRLAYHFWRWHPHDTSIPRTSNLRDRVRVPASEVLHVFDVNEAGQIRGAPRVARSLIKLFTLEVYDDAELDRKKTAALFTAFLVGRGEMPITEDEDEDADEDTVIGAMEPGAIVDLGDDKDIRFSTPSESGQSYEPFQYRNLLKICAGLGVPYSYVTGDVTRGNFSNVRTDIIRFRRRTGQWQFNTMIFQFCRPVWIAFVERAVLSGKIELPGYDEDPSQWWACEWLPPRQEWIDPAKDIKAEKEAVDSGFKSQTQVIAERGYDREDIFDEIEEERKDAKRRGLTFAGAVAEAEAQHDPEAAAQEREDAGESEVDGRESDA